MLSRSPKYQPLKQTSDSPEPESIANPQVQLPSPDSRTPPQPSYPISSTIPPLQPEAQTLEQTSDSPDTSAVRVTTMKTSFGRSPVRTHCPKCKTRQVTRTKYRFGTGGSYLLACGWIVLCMPCCMDVEHSCPNCNYVLQMVEAN